MSFDFLSGLSEEKAALGSALLNDPTSDALLRVGKGRRADLFTQLEGSGPIEQPDVGNVILDRDWETASEC